MALRDLSSPTYRQLLAALEDELKAVDVDTPRRTAEWMLIHVIDRSRAEIYAHGEDTAGPEDVAVLERMLERRRRREPLQYILGHTEFFGLRLRVTPAVLIPRPETECVVEQLLDKIVGIDRPRLLDIGTGSGCIALAAANERQDAAVVACDNSRDALEVARINARELGLTVQFRYADLTAPEFLSGDQGTFDAVVSNPPYVTPAERDALAPEVRRFEPEAALFTPGDPLHFYRGIAEHGRRLLKPGGWLILETHADHGSDVVELLEIRGYGCVEILRDRAGRERVAVGMVRLRQVENRKFKVED